MSDHPSPDAESPTKSYCVVVTGPPCSGKSWVAEHLSERLGLPLISKDDYKETLFDSFAGGQPLDDAAINHAAYDLLYATLENLLRGGIPLIVESNFRPERDSGRLRDLFKQHGYAVQQVHCDAPADLLLKRFFDRWEAGQRHPVHDDQNKIETIAESLRERRYGALDLPGRLFSLDTTHFARVDLDALIAQLADALP